MSTKSKFDNLIEIFRKSSEEAAKKCSSESEKLRRLMVDSNSVFTDLWIEERKTRISLMDMRIFELWRLTAHILYLSLSGLYKNAFDNIRYIFESAIQSLYIDSRHSVSGLRTRIEILKEIEDKREYRAVSLIDRLEIDHKDSLKKEYKRLSQIIHPSHRSIVEFLDFTQKLPSPELLVAPTNCKEISDIFESMRIVFDMVWFLYISCAPKKRRKQLQSDSALIKYSKKYNLTLLSKIMKTNLVKKRGKGKKNRRE